MSPAQRPERRGDLLRPRLLAVLEEVTAATTLVLGPPGTGKSCLLDQYAARSADPVARVTASAADRDPLVLLQHLRGALERVGVGDPGVPATDAGDVAGLLARLPASSPPLVLVLDDAHVLHGSPAEAVLGRLLAAAGEALRLVVAGRLAPELDLWPQRLRGQAVLVGPEQLAFRRWEVDRLFRERYDVHLATAELDGVMTATGGWAAALPVLHAAWSRHGRALVERLPAHPRLLAEYVEEVVLAGLDDGLRSFLTATAPLPRLSPLLCDRLLGRADSADRLQLLERLHLLGEAVDEPGTFRLPVLLSRHLLDRLERGRGGDAHAAHLAAALLLEEAGRPGEALSAYARAEQWPAVGELLVRHRDDLGLRALASDLPDHLRRSDPAALLAEARRRLRAGALHAAAEAYGAAERASLDESFRQVCRREAEAPRSLAGLTDSGPDGRTWPRRLRDALVRDAACVAAETPPEATPRQDLVTGVAALLAGDLEAAEQRLRELARGGRGDLPVAHAAALAGGLVDVLVERRGDVEGLDRLSRWCEDTGHVWLARLASALLAVADAEAAPELSALLRDADRDGDAWGAALLALLGAVAGRSRGTDADGAACSGADRFAALGAKALRAWCVLAGTSAAGRADRDQDAAASSCARLAAARLGLDDRSSLVRHLSGRPRDLRPADRPGPGRPGRLRPATAVEEQGGQARDGDRPPPAPDPAQLRVLCFDRFRLLVDERPVDLSGLRPRARAVLRLLALHAGRQVHREQVIDALWPGASGASPHTLQVAVSALRRALRDALPAGVAVPLQREGETYGLAGELWCDHTAFDALCRESVDPLWDDSRRSRALRAALGLYAGPLLPEDGPAEWVVADRDRRAQQAANAATSLAALELRAGRLGEAIRACQRALEIDPFRDDAAGLLVGAYEARGDASAARRAADAHRRLLSDLGVEQSA